MAKIKLPKKLLSMVIFLIKVRRSYRDLRDCLCKSGPADFSGDTDLAHFLCVVRHSCTYAKTIIRLIRSL